MVSSESAAEELLESIRWFLFRVYQWPKKQCLYPPSKAQSVWNKVELLPGWVLRSIFLYKIVTGKRRGFVHACISLQYKTGMWLESAPSCSRSYFFWRKYWKNIPGLLLYRSLSRYKNFSLADFNLASEYWINFQ